MAEGCPRLTVVPPVAGTSISVNRWGAQPCNQGLLQLNRPSANVTDDNRLERRKLVMFGLPERRGAVAPP
jgi:hypothetical protein